jgi:hypothetical protein
MNVAQDIHELYFKDTSFVDLMTRRIFNVLLIANPYDAFMLEDDGRIDEKLFIEYTDLSLRYPPRFTLVSTREEAFERLHQLPFDLVICMPGAEDSNIFDIARSIKEQYEFIPLVVLTPFSHGITARMENEDLSIFEYVFCWLGNTDLLLSIIKLIEDQMNLQHDVKEVGVQVIMLVEDSIRFYSSVLPNLYKFVLQQSQEFSTEALNSHQRTLRMRGRPKIVLVRNYEEAMETYEMYKDNMLGIISDVRFLHHGKIDKKAGIKFCAQVRKRDPFVPIIIQSSESENRAYALHYEASYIDKNSKKMDVDLRKAIANNFGFGDFIFRNPTTMEEIARVRNLKELQNILFAVPRESFLYHIRRNHISRWLYSRAVFPPAVFLKSITWDSLQDVDAHRRIIFEAIVKYRKMKNQGVVAVFERNRFDSYSNFARIGEGSLGGKARGLAFIDNMIKRHTEFNQFEHADVMIPKTVVLCTDIFDEFMESNNLYKVALSDADDACILSNFLHAKLPNRLIEDFFTFFKAAKAPIAVRSSSLLEDAHYQPFAGIYSTYMIPYSEDKYEMLEMLSKAIKGVYASVYFKDSKAYMQATSNVIDQEKMAVILQEVVGNQYDDRYYPTMSGVARSLNFYPLGDEKAEEGVVNLALGLGKYIVDGGQTLRFSPYHPRKILQLSEMELTLKETQKRFYALDLKNLTHEFSTHDDFNLLRLQVKEAEVDGSLRYISSTYDARNQMIRDGYYPNGRKLNTFANVLQHDYFPLAPLLQQVLKNGQQEMRRPVEIEFAATLSPDKKKHGTFYVLQIRPIVDSTAVLEEDLTLIDDSEVLLRSQNSLGHGVMNDIYDLIYVKTGVFNAKYNPDIAEEIAEINQKMLNEGRHYVLVGPGRWGTSDPWLGIPVKWPHISAARVIVEAGLEHYRIDPSQGTHFFQNLTSFGVGYFTINSYMNDGIFKEHYLNQQEAIQETDYLRHIRFKDAIQVKMDGKKKQGVVMLPQK